jgi:hypothetical protein
VIQYIDDKSYVVWPKSQAMREAVLPLLRSTRCPAYWLL